MKGSSLLAIMLIVGGGVLLVVGWRSRADQFIAALTDGK